MHNWQEDLFNALLASDNLQDVMDATLKTIKPMGFDFCSWRSAQPMPLAKKSVAILNSNEDNIARKASGNAYKDTPGVIHCSQSSEPFRWHGTTNEEHYFKIPDIMDECYSLGHRGGWAQSLITAPNFYSMLWVDSKDSLSTQDLDHVDFKLQWIATAVLSRTNQLQAKTSIHLTAREEEVLRWSGDGKTAEQIGMILSISHSTVNYHLRNAMKKLDAPNKTTAIIRAIFLRLLHG